MSDGNKEVVLVDISTQGTKEIHELGQAVKNIMKVSKQALADGWQPGMDVPVIITGSLGGLMTAVDGVNKIGAEAKAEPIKASLSALIPVAEGIDLLLEKKEESGEEASA